jgi:hypothetical protein
MKHLIGAATVLALAVVSAGAETKVYPADSLVIPMDTTYQDHGMLEAYGLVYDLLLAGLPVDWTIEPGKEYGGVDFVASAEDVASEEPIVDHGYRGGPFVIDGALHDDALPIVLAWQTEHPAVAVHRATAPFSAEVSREMRVAPSIAIFVDHKEVVAFEYLNAAGIPQANGDPWPDKRDTTEEYACPGEQCCPDCLNEAETSGPTTESHSDGDLFDPSGNPYYCQFMSMAYKEPAAVPEVVAEVREFLQHRVHFFAEGEAVTSFENASDGYFLTLNGLVAGIDSNDVDRYHSGDPFAQADGGFESGGGDVPSFTLASGSAYHDPNVVMLSVQGSALGTNDIWMNGHVDADPDKGKVSYLAGKIYGTQLPISTHPETQGTRYFLNSLFEAPCSADEGWAEVSTWIEGPDGTNFEDYTVTACFENEGPGLAFDATLELDLPEGAEFVSASDGGVESGGIVTWELGTLAAGDSDCYEVDVTFEAEGSYGFVSTLTYFLGRNEYSVDSGPPTIVRFGSINLLRHEVHDVADRHDPFVGRHPAEPALDPGGDLEVTAFTSGLQFPHDVSDLLPGSPVLVFYELDGDSGGTLRVDRDVSKAVVTY